MDWDINSHDVVVDTGCGINDAQIFDAEDSFGGVVP